MSNQNEKDNSAKNNEKDLNDLLDSKILRNTRKDALKDFENFDSAEKSDDKKGDPASSEVSEVWNEEFFTEQAQLLGERVNAIFGAEGGESLSPEQIAVGFQKMAEAAAVALQGEVTDDDAGKKYADSISEALKGLKEGVDNLQAPVSENEIANMFSGLNIEGEDSDKNPFLPFMQGMMQSLLSAEILLPSIKELLEKYPKYLEKNSEKISKEDKERYLKQQELFSVICQDLEAEKPDDTPAVKQERFKRVLDNMQKLHEYGQPPEDLIGDVGQGLPGLDPTAGANAQCPIM